MVRWRAYLSYARLIAAIGVAISVVVLVSPSNATAAAPQAGGKAPPPCIYFDGHCYFPCPDPSGICPPTEDTVYLPYYGWIGTASGTEWADEFTGSTLNSTTWFEQDTDATCNQNITICHPPGGSSPNAWWSTNQVALSNGELQLETVYTTSDSDCETYYGLTPPSGCWVSGGIGQHNVTGTPWMDYGQAAVDLKVTGAGIGSTGILNLDNVLQLGSYGVAWPPEIDFMEQGGSVGLGHFNAYEHCGIDSVYPTGVTVSGSSLIWSFSSGVTVPTGMTVKVSGMEPTTYNGTFTVTSGGTDVTSVTTTGGNGQAAATQFGVMEPQDVLGTSPAITATLTDWNVFEVDWTSSTVTITVTPVSGGSTQTVTFNKPSSGWCNTDWPPVNTDHSSSSSMGLFMQSEMIGGNTTQEGSSETLNIDWIAERQA